MVQHAQDEETLPAIAEVVFSPELASGFAFKKDYYDTNVHNGLFLRYGVLTLLNF